ncbi:MAG: serine/threonine-protein kinase, partial [Planctomycetota bacterium]
MKSRLDTEFGNLAVSEGFTTSEKVQISQRIVDAFEAEDPRKCLDVILLDRGYITHEQWVYLLKKLGITVILCPHCNKRFKEANVDIGNVIACKHCGETFEYKVTSEMYAHQASSMCDNTLSPLEQPTYDHYIGKLLGGKYKIIEKIATGGWSTIYKAKRTLLDIDDIVAVKILHLNLSDNPQDIKRFYNEAATIRELRHPNAIHLYDFDRDSNGTIYMAMEFIYGKNLKETIKDTGPFDVARMLNIIYQVCDVISTAHKHPKKIIHRDITPQNIMLTRVGETDDFVKVLDFGIVKLRTHDNVSLTGSIVGTPPYMAPEQWRGECDERTDIYSLGIIMYEMLTGESPFKGDQITLMNKHLNERPPPFRKINKNLESSKIIENIIFKCLEKNKNKRPHSIDELKLLLQEAEDSASKKITTYAKVGVLAAILAILTIPFIVYVFFLSNKHEEKLTATSG